MKKIRCGEILFAVIIAASGIGTLYAEDSEPFWKRIVSNVYGTAAVNFLFGLVDNSGTDVVSGATGIGARGGIHVDRGLWSERHFVETGAEVMYLPQEIKYNDPLNGYSGSREFNMVLARIPLAYNLHMFNDENGNPLIIFKMGLYFSFPLYRGVSDSGTVPDYTMKSYSRELFIALCVFPYDEIGFFLEACRGGKAFYEDAYHDHSDSGMGDLAGFSFGVKYRLNCYKSRVD